MFTAGTLRQRAGRYRRWWDSQRVCCIIRG